MQTRFFLSSRIRKPGNSPLLGLLHVMACVGHSTVLTPHRVLKTVDLMRVLDSWASGNDSGEDPVVQQAAIACREAIQQKMDLARSGEQLLRASAPPLDRPTSLLRPAQGAAPTESQELLRSGSFEGAPIGKE